MVSCCQMAVWQERIAARRRVQENVEITVFGLFLLHSQDNWERWIMKHRSVDRDILVVIILSIIALVLAFIAPADWLPFRILTLPLVLLLPGYALTSALLPRQTLGIAERLLLSLGLSLTI